jgi:hypothetical protein
MKKKTALHITRQLDTIGGWVERGDKSRALGTIHGLHDEIMSAMIQPDDVTRMKDLTERFRHSIETKTPCELNEEELAFLLFIVDDEDTAEYLRRSAS